MFAVALDRAGIAYTSGCPFVVVFGWRRIAGQAGENGLSQRSENFGACVDTLTKCKRRSRLGKGPIIHKAEPRGHRLQELLAIE